MKSKKLMITRIFAIVSLIAAVMSMFLLFISEKNRPAIGINFPRSIGIIGGSDGPTSIFIASKVTNSTLIYAITPIILLFAVIGYIVYKKINKK